ncbi:MAG: RHS domain-containing protein [Rhodocyclaceae bacterium]|nr:RHS domain-containing protein [Rhodocyclaceae bacterium]
MSTTYGWHPQRSVSTDPVFKRDHQGRNTTEHYYHNDHAGTPQKLTNAAGEITWAAYQEAFGRTTVDSGVNPQATVATTNNLRFAGQYDDSETGLHHNGLRDYDPTTGRYLQTDPIGLAGGLNTYAYVEGDPVNFIDPTGENPAALLYVYARCVAQCTAQSAAGDFLDNTCPEFGDYAKDCALSCANPLNWLGGRGGPGRVGARGPGRGAGPPPVRGPQQRIEAPEIGKNVGGNTKGGGGNGDVGRSAMADTASTTRVEDLVRKAQQDYPKKAGKFEDHHVVPKYLGGDPKGETVRIDAAYHQTITNAFRELQGYRQPKPSTERLREIVRQVYEKFPLPKK